MADLDPNIEMLRFSTAGSVDDGKSTLIGRLLVDTRGVFEDQLDAARNIAKQQGSTNGAHLALLTDGLQAEREQGITIDVAYRYFATPKRKFIIADTPGHEQYTRNMVTGASTAQLAIILVDARKGLLVQSRRHAYISALLGIRHVVVAINKMDLVNYQREPYDAVVAEFTAFCDKLAMGSLQTLHFIPLSALQGDMVVTRGDHLTWYDGPTLLEVLENTVLSYQDHQMPLRFPVQLVSRPQTEALHDFRGYMGRIESGEVAVGDVVTILPSGLRSRVKEIIDGQGSIPSAHAPMSVTLTLEDECDISRGDMLTHGDEAPSLVKEFDALLCWMHETPLQVGKKYSIKHLTSTIKALVQKIEYRVDVNTLQHADAQNALQMNEIGYARLRLLKPVACDAYRSNRVTGSFIIIDDFTNQTVGAGMIA